MSPTALLGTQGYPKAHDKSLPSRIEGWSKSILKVIQQCVGVGQPSVNGPPLPTFIAGNDHDFNERANDSDVDEQTSDDSVSWSSREQPQRPDFLEKGIPGLPASGFPGLWRRPGSWDVFNNGEKSTRGRENWSSKREKSFLDHKQGNKIIHIWTLCRMFFQCQ